MKPFPLRLVLIALIAMLLSTPALALPEGVQTLELGEEAPPFKLKGVDGRTYTLEDFAEAKVLVIIFTCNHCPTAQAYEGRIKQLAADYKDQGVAVVAISPNDPKALRLNELGFTALGDTYRAMKIRAKAHDFNFPYLYDGDKQQTARAYGPVATPHVFIFDEERKLRYVGRIDDSDNPAKVTSRDARNAINALLAGEPVPVKKTKVFGCSVKWSEKRASVKRANKRWARREVDLKMIDAEGIKKLVRNDSEKLRLINIWATWCGPCVAEFPMLIEMARMYGHRDFELITISADSPDRREQVIEFLEEQEAAVTNYLFSSDDQYALIEAVDKKWPGALPYTMLIAPGGKVLYRHMGMIDPLELKREIVGYLGRYYFETQKPLYLMSSP